MNWQELDALLDEQLLRLLDHARPLEKLSQSLDFVPHSIEVLEAQAASKLDAAILGFAETRQWPALSENETSMLCLRLEFAVRLSSFLQTPGARRALDWTAPLAMPDMLRWLLTEAWQDYGFEQIRSMASSLLRPGGSARHRPGLS